MSIIGPVSPLIVAIAAVIGFFASLFDAPGPPPARTASSAPPPSAHVVPPAPPHPPFAVGIRTIAFVDPSRTVREDRRPTT